MTYPRPSIANGLLSLCQQPNVRETDFIGLNKGLRARTNKASYLPDMARIVTSNQTRSTLLTLTQNF
ncbi:hypothetical protein NPIL_172811, partial [Nephila pilipes]